MTEFVTVQCTRLEADRWRRLVHYVCSTERENLRTGRRRHSVYYVCTTERESLGAGCGWQAMYYVCTTERVPGSWPRVASNVLRVYYEARIPETWPRATPQPINYPGLRSCHIPECPVSDSNAPGMPHECPLNALRQRAESRRLMRSPDAFLGLDNLHLGMDCSP